MAWENGDWNWAWSISHAVLWLLVLARVLGLCLTAPALAVPELDWRVRLGSAVFLAGVVIPIIEPRIAAPAGWVGLVRAGFLELLAGGALGLSAALIVAGARLAGELVAAQAGLSTASLLDPGTGEALTPIGRLYGWIALLVFLALDGPLVLVRALVESYSIVPAGEFLISRETAQLAFGEVGRTLELALRAAAPGALALALTGIVLCWLGRAASSLSFVALALPIRGLLGIVVVLLSLATLVATLSGAWLIFPWGR